MKTHSWSRSIAVLFPYLGARRGWVVNATPWPLYSQKRPGTHCIGGWVSPRVGLDGCEKSRCDRDSIPGPPSMKQVAILTVLSWPHYKLAYWDFMLPQCLEKFLSISP
jgi:hypothetical protein